MTHKWILYRRRTGLSQERLAELLDVSRHYVIRLEQGIYRRPSKETLAKLASILRVTEAQLLSDYFEFQREKRKEFAEKFENFNSLTAYSGTKHPLVYWRETQGLSRIGLCKELCIHQDSLRDYELQLQTHIPEQLEEALNQINWPIETLVNAVREWKLSGRAA